MREQIVEALKTRFGSTDDLISSLDEKTLVQKLDVPKHKSMAEHLWCLIGTRESYARAIAEGKWEGFSCSMTSLSKNDFLVKALTAATAVTTAVSDVQDWTAERDQLLLTLSEHEVMHEGQIIRHMYALELEVPASLRWA